MRAWLDVLVALVAIPVLAVVVVACVAIAPIVWPLWAVGRLAWRAATDRLLAGRRSRRWRALCEDAARWEVAREETLVEARVLSAALGRDAAEARAELLGSLQVVGIVVAGGGLLAAVLGLLTSGTLGAALDAGVTVAVALALVCSVMWGALAVVIACDRRVARLDAAILMERVALSHDVTGGLSLIDEATAARLRGALSSELAQRGQIEEVTHG